MKKSKSRRSFLKKVTLGSAAFTTAPYIFGKSYEQKFELSKHYSQVNYSTNNQINLGLRAAGAALLANEGYYQGKPIDWDPNSMKLL